MSEIKWCPVIDELLYKHLDWWPICFQVYSQCEGVQEIFCRSCGYSALLQPSFFSAFSLYDFKTDIMKQTAVAHISTIITFILFIGTIIYHVILLVKKERPAEDLDEYPLASVNPVNAEVTHSVIEPPKRDDEDPPPADRKDSDEQEITEDRQIVTLPYKV